MTTFQVTVPGNLLLAGEYAVLEEGGLGAAIAVEPRLVVTVFPQDDWELVGRWVGGGERWTPGTEPTFAGRVFLAALEALEGRGDERGRRWSHRTQPARIEIDSSGFFDAQGRKKGYGSSAALAAGLTATLARLGDRDPGDAHPIAVGAHRTAQGGAGSGYDVTVSWYGGFGRFIGGLVPRWEPADPRMLPPLALFDGPEAVRTVGSISRYRTWKETHPDAARDFLDASNAAVAALTRAGDPAGLLFAWDQCRRLGLDLGTHIGSDATLSLPPGLDPSTFVKALGAGNETGLVAGDLPSPLPEGLFPLTCSPEGLRWE